MIVVCHGGSRWTATGGSKNDTQGLRITSSPLGRAYEPASLIVRSCGGHVTVEPALIEQHLGVWTGVAIDDIEVTSPVPNDA